ncbi:hypothetical protein [Actinomadura macrotermitis]|uniref:Uncharacterized protein n=1 Tax=Actinomadura macrotermitis TaxID=2585200 RepID=A0A7K0BUQ2_9ACTN|nr:hypothetical protein [Actinomadura macrotermitis]MQY04935.1 hypothetical protein [Actinomadura macrotermitis]
MAEEADAGRMRRVHPLRTLARKPVWRLVSLFLVLGSLGTFVMPVWDFATLLTIVYLVANGPGLLLIAWPVALGLVVVAILILALTGALVQNVPQVSMGPLRWSMVLYAASSVFWFLGFSYPWPIFGIFFFVKGGAATVLTAAALTRVRRLAWPARLLLAVHTVTAVCLWFIR